MDKMHLEKSLKRFLKRKVSYSLSLLVTFMITGMISFGATNTQAVKEIKTDRAKLLNKVETEQEALSRRIKENEDVIKEYNNNLFKLIQKGDFYSKPVFASSQVFFTYNHINNSKVKNNTDEEWAPSIKQIQEFNDKNSNNTTRGAKTFGMTTFASSTSPAISTLSSGNALGELIEQNGLLVNSEVFKETIKLGANVEPQTPDVKVNVNVSVEAPQITLGTLPEKIHVDSPKVGKVSVPTLNLNTSVPTISVNVNAPGEVAKIDVAIPEVEAPKPSVPDVPTVEPPTTPAGFVPKMIVAPEAPTAPVVKTPDIPTFALNVKSDGNGTSNWVDNSSGSNAVIEMVAVTDGEFTLERDSSSKWNYSYKNYSGMNAWAVGSAKNDGGSNVASGGTWSNQNRSGAVSSGSQLGFQKLVGSSKQSTMLTNADFLYTRKLENASTNLGEFVHMDYHGAASVSSQRAGLVNATKELANKQRILDAYDDAGNNFNLSSSASANRYTWINSGKIVVEGGNVSITNNYDHSGTDKNIAINDGTIVFQPIKSGDKVYGKYGSVFVMSLDGNDAPCIMYNSGDIKMYSPEMAVYLSNSKSNGRPLTTVNRGNVEINGEKSVGIYLKTGSNTEVQFVNKDGSFNPIKMFGDKGMGLYGQSTASTLKGNFAVDIGSKGVGNKTFTTTERTAGDKLTNHNINPSGSNENIEGTFGILSNAAINLDKHQIRIFDKVEKSVGVYPNSNVTLTLGNGEILLDGGESEKAQENIGIYVNEKGNVVSSGDVNLLGGRENMAIYVKGSSGKITSVANITGDKTKDSIYIYGENGAKINVGNLAIKEAIADNIDDNKKNTTIAFANGANTQINVNADGTAATPETPNINITGKNSKKGLAFMSKDGGQIVAKNQNINVVNGSTVVASMGANSKVDLKGSKINYDGAGYAIYAHDKGEIDLSDVELHLGGKSTAWDLIGSKATAEDKGEAGEVITNDKTKIVVDSNDVVVFNLIGADKLETDNLSQTINNEVTGSASGTGTTQIWQDGKDKDGNKTDKYIVAAVDGGTLKVGNLDKAGTNTDTEDSKKNGYFYYRRFLGQRLNATITKDSTVQAILSSDYAKEYFHNQVAAFEMNSSSKATDNTEAQINIEAGATVKADRIDANPDTGGAVGLFINFGKIDNKGTVLVEKEADSSENKAQNQAIGIYAVNGSEVENNGEIKVGGDSSIGLLGLGNREADGKPIAKEFGGKTGEGTISLTNKGTLTLDGTGSIGIYAKNNSSKGVNEIKAINDKDATLTVGNKGFGMLGDKATITNSGKITTGEAGISIYATNETQVAEVGDITLNNKAIGVMLDGSSKITDTNDLVFTSSVDKGKDQTAIYLTGDNTISNNIDISGLTGGIGIFADNANMEYDSGKTITVGESGIGIYLDGAGKTATNKGTIKPANEKNNSIGMFTKSGTVVNDGTIVIAGDNQVAMYGESENAHIKNTGFIDFEKDNTTGIYIKDGATATYGAGSQEGAPLLRFNNGVKQIGIFAENAKIKVEKCMEFKSPNEKENIFVYANKGSELVVNSGVNMEAIGVNIPTAEADKNKKSIGAYLDATDKENTFTNNGTLKVTVGAIGVYSKGNNTISNENVEVTGDKTTGIFLDGGASLKGANNFKLANKAVGVYATSGKVNLESDVNINVATEEGAGFYLIDGAAINGQKIVFENKGADHSIAAYYDKGTNANEVINKTDIELAGSKAAVGIYAANGINLTNESNISGATGKDIAVYVAGNSNYKGSGDIVMTGNDSLGIFVGEGSAENSGTIDVSGSNATTGTPSGAVAGMLAKSTVVGEKATVTNSGTIKIGAGDSKIGMYISGAGNNKGVNKGIIDNSDALGVYVEGATNSFDGTNGEIKTKTGIYLKDTVEKAVTNIGKLSIKQDGVGVVAENSVVDFDIKTGNETTGLYAKGTSKISNNNVEVGDGSVGIYLENANIIDGITVKTGATTGTGAIAKTSVGIVAKGAGTYNIDAKDINANDGIGIYLDSTQTRILNFDGNLTTKGGIGFYIDENNTLNTGVAKDTTITVEGGTGIYAKGTANIGKGAKNTKFIFNGENSTGVYSDGGTVDFGTNVQTEGKGTLVATKNGNLEVSGSKINVTDGAVGLLGTYDSGTTSAKITFNGDTIDATNGAIGIAAVRGDSDPTGTVSIINNGKISASGNHTIAIYSDVAKIENTKTITVGNDGIGIYADATGKDISNTGDIKLTGENGIGLYVSKNAGTINSGKITGVNDTKSVGLLLSEVAHDVDIDNISLGDGSIGVVTTGNNLAERTLKLKGEIKVGNSITGNGAKSSIGIVANEGSKVKVDTSNANAKITVGEKGIGVYAVDNGSSIETVLDKIKVGKDGILAMAADGSTLVAKGNGNAVVVDGGTGVIAKNATVTLNNVNLEVKNGGTGVYVDGNVLPTITGGNIKVDSGTEEKKSIGAYYANVQNLNNNIVPVKQAGDNTIGTVLDKATGVNYSQDVTTNGNGNISFVLKNGSDITTSGKITIGNGDKNVGIYGENSTITAKGGLEVGNGAVGIYGKDSGSITVNNSSIAVLDDHAVGVYAKGIDATVTTDITVGNNGSIGIISEGTGDIDLSSGTISTIGEESIGIYKSGTKAISTLSGTRAVTPSTIKTGAGNWNVGDRGFAIFIDGDQNVTVDNGADIKLGESAVGIYSKGANIVNNSGEITVGKTNVNGDDQKIENHRNSVGIYLAGGAEGTNTGTINVKEDHSIGVYVQDKGTKFTNENQGTINVDGGGVGILVRGGATAENAKGATINLGTVKATCGAKTIGMAVQEDGKIINNGIINVDDGIGMLVGMGGTFENKGKIVVDNGIGIEGPGSLVNSGTIDVTDNVIHKNPGANTGKLTSTGAKSESKFGGITINDAGKIIVGKNYTSIGGTITSPTPIVVNGSLVDMTSNKPMFSAPDVSGEIRPLSNFLTTGNGISWVFDNVIDSARTLHGMSEITITTSPFVLGKVTADKKIVLAVKNYADLTINNQFDKINQGAFNLLGYGEDKDKIALKEMNKALNDIYLNQGAEKSTEVAGKWWAEWRGDIYSTIQERMQNVNAAFDSSFNELESSYNNTKDVGKYSVIYTDGDYDNNTLGINSYDYYVRGLLYMKEKEGLKLNSKYGYSLGFANTKFKFKNIGSEETINSLRAGLHMNRLLNETHNVSLLSRLTLGYNRHTTDRDVVMNKTYHNKASYNTYGVELDNRLSKQLLRDFSKELNVYGSLNLEYGKLEGFKEKDRSEGFAELEVKKNDYFSTQGGVGVNGNYKLYVKDDFVVKTSADAKFVYEFEENYKGNETRVYNGREGYDKLITPKEKKGALVGTFGIGVEKANQYGVTFEVTAKDESNKTGTDVNYGVRFNYKW